MGFVILVAMGVYLLISLGVVVWAISYAKKNGKSAKKWGWGAVLALYMIPFWDWIPTVVVHQYYCEKEAGFWVYKTLDQWKAENPGVMEGLAANKGYPSSHDGDMNNFVLTSHWNPRFDLVYKHNGPLFLHRWGREDLLIDTKTNETLARFVDFSTSYQRRQAGWSGWKFWLDSENCSSGRETAIQSGNWMGQFKGAGK